MPLFAALKQEASREKRQMSIQHVSYWMTLARKI